MGQPGHGLPWYGEGGFYYSYEKDDLKETARKDMNHLKMKAIESLNSKLLTFTKDPTSPIIEVRFHNGVKLGEIYEEVGGEYVSWLNIRGGFWSGAVLKEIARALEILNEKLPGEIKSPSDIMSDYEVSRFFKRATGRKYYGEHESAINDIRRMLFQFLKEFFK